MNIKIIFYLILHLYPFIAVASAKQHTDALALELKAQDIELEKRKFEIKQLKERLAQKTAACSELCRSLRTPPQSKKKQKKAFRNNPYFKPEWPRY
jgi:hypothetical protein